MTKRTRIPGHAHTLHAELAKLDVDGMARRVHSMANAGIGEHTTAELLGLHVDQVRRILSERRE
jgi:hypothetical protein